MNIPDWLQDALKQMGAGVIVLVPLLYLGFVWAEQEHSVLSRNTDINRMINVVDDLDDRYYELGYRLQDNPNDGILAKRYHKTGLQLERAQSRLEALQERAQE